MTATSAQPRLLDIESRDETVIVTPTASLSEFDFQRIEAEAKAVLALFDDRRLRNAVIDLCRTAYSGSTALGFFVRLWKKVSLKGGRMAVCNASPQEREILSVTGIDTLWPICASREEALRVVEQPQDKGERQ
jgi:anti-anti-sigma factor